MESVGIEVKLRVDAININEGAFVVTKGSGSTHGNYSLILTPANNDVQFTFSSPGVNPGVYVNPQYSSGLAANFGEQTHVMMTYTLGNADSMEMQVNNIAGEGQWILGDGNVPPIVPDLPLTIGKRTLPFDFNSYYSGLIDEVLIYRK